MSRVHVVQHGETLSKIADAYYGVMRLFTEIAAVNGIDPDYIEVGQELIIPDIEEAPIHVVTHGETLGSIAQFWYGDSSRYEDIASSNGLDDPDQIDVGQELMIPLSV